ncbi:hypothetical protein K370107A2_09980 [Merdimmobilis hominis]
MQGEMAKTAENLDAIFSEIIQTKRKLHRPKFYKNASDSSEKVWCNPWCKPLYKKKNPHSNAGLSGKGGQFRSAGARASHSGKEKSLEHELRPDSV